MFRENIRAGDFTDATAKVSVRAALRAIEAESGTAFSPKIVEALSAVLATLPPSADAVRAVLSVSAAGSEALQAVLSLRRLASQAHG